MGGGGMTVNFEMQTLGVGWTREELRENLVLIGGAFR